MQKMLRIVNNLILSHLSEAENSLQIQKHKSTATRQIRMLSVKANDVSFSTGALQILVRVNDEYFFPMWQIGEKFK